jgi:two-component system CheB/CheR fusion protein
MMRILPYRTIDNVIDGVVITFVDITERRRSEEDLARLAAIVASSHDAILGLTPEGVITTWNAGAERTYGYTPEEAVGQAWSLVMGAQRAAEMRGILDRVKRSRAATTVETQRLTKDGREIHVASTISPIRNPAGKLVLLSAIERDTTERVHAEERQRMLLAELNHRVKNTLATVLSISSQTLRYTHSVEAFRDAFEGRIRALAKAHDVLAAADWAGADLGEIVKTELAPYARDDRVEVAGEPISVPPSAALMLGMVFHELATNAAKHGAFQNHDGKVEVSWKRDGRGGRRLAIQWTERDGPAVAPPGKDGFGLKLIERGLAHELQGRASFDFTSQGLRASLEIPLGETPPPPPRRNG